MTAVALRKALAVNEISGQAIDRASLHCRDIWYRTRKGSEGIHTWLLRISREALSDGEPDINGYCFHLGMALGFSLGDEELVLRSVMRTGVMRAGSQQK